MPAASALLLAAATLLAIPAGAHARTCGSSTPNSYSPGTITHFTVDSGPVASDEVAEIHASLHLPPTATALTAAPVVLQTHGGGANRTTMHGNPDHEALFDGLIERGYAVVTGDTRGNGESKDAGSVRKNRIRYYITDPDREVADVQALIEYVAGCDEIEQDGPGDPRVAMAGISNAANIQLAAAAAEPTPARLDAITPMWTSGEIDQDFIPNNVAKAWWGRLYRDVWGYPLEEDPNNPEPEGVVAIAGHFHDIHREVMAGAATQTARTPPGSLTNQRRAAFAQQSLVPRASSIRSPTLFVQGWADTGTPPQAAIDLYREIKSSPGTPVKLLLPCRGHGGCPYFDLDPNAGRSLDAVFAWLNRHLLGAPIDTGAEVEWQDQSSDYRTGDPASILTPSLTAKAATLGESRRVAWPPLVVADPLKGFQGGDSADGGGRTPKVERDASGSVISPPLFTHASGSRTCLPILGTPLLTVRGSVETGSLAWVFFELLDAGSGDKVLGRQVLPLILADDADGAFETTVPMPGAAWMVKPGHTLGLEITTGSGHFMEPEDRVPYSVRFDSIEVALPLGAPVAAEKLITGGYRCSG